MKINIFFMPLIFMLTFVLCKNNTEPIIIQSPQVAHFEWGHITVGSTQFKDCRLWPNHQEEWDWRKTNTRHVPGIQISDVSDFVDEVDVIILSQGVDGVLQIIPKTLEYLQAKKKEVHCARTPQAIELYNKFVASHTKVGALLHSTC